ncbi:hypothetical protein [Leptothoe spongobia]|uniref:Uncharacterized protein n=1 Tax=Leptothoe spongobia TAU-MAC 1115 TaxID=1967444 RepID=A0A947DIW3_9CYAN|nr:hypothetical protein [Leptothoe spongobia]MBT9317783.1 hypothetical protein [Leptothoe spongobia TAU-MAC 1115]
MKKLAIAGLGVGVLSVGLYFGANLYGTNVAEAKVNKLIDGMEEENLTVEYKDISYKPLAQDVHVKDITITSKDDPAEVTIEKVVIRDIDEKSDVPTVFDASVQGLVVDLNQPEQLAMANFLKQAGYDSELSFDIDTKYRYNKAKREMNVEAFKVSADQVGDLTVNMKLGNVDPEVAESQEAALANTDVIFHGLEITYRDGSFAEKFLASMAAEDGKSVDELKAELTSQLTGASQFLLSPDNELATNAVDEVVAFIENPKGFSISAKPEQPMQLVSLMTENPDSWMDMLNIEVKSF